jgi:NADPH:quinone reductase-like Zn-dependent oxidoreductase
LAELTATARLTPFVSHTLPLTEAAEAHRLLATGPVRGKIVLSVAAG